MKIVMLSGGKGKRLWPVSTDTVPKQFVKLFKDSTNMLERTLNKVKRVEKEENLYVATCREYKKEVKNYINKSNIIIEPAMIGTFGAILNIAVYLKYNGCKEDEIISVVPVDHDVDDDFYSILVKAQEQIIKRNTSICLVGINPTYPSTQYGYILTNNGLVDCFKEKPSIEEANELITNNALWNSGIVVFKLKRIFEIAKKYLDFNDYKGFNEKYLTLPHISFDYEVLEKEEHLSIVKSNSSWNDIGTWNILADKIKEVDEYNTNIVNFEQKEIRNQGIKNAILVNSAYGILLTPKKNENIVYRTWGFYEVINNYDYDTNHLKIKKISILKGKNISYQYHKNRGETWFVLSGTGEVILDGIKKSIKPGDIVTINKEEKHAIKALENIEIIEIQHGNKPNVEEDIIRLEYNWDKIELNNGKKA